jgi:uncharacterized oligopeptide transporter (OPT) family protein
MPCDMAAQNDPSSGLKRFLPRIGSPTYHVMLGFVAMFILGPLGGISAAFMNFSIGFYVGGQVLAGILGSTVTLPYGPEGKHGANYMQTLAASVAGMCGMGVLMQAMVWMGLPEPPVWKLALYFMCIGMFGVGVGMLYTPVLVDKMQLAYPSGFAVANILRAVTDPKLLKRSIAKLGGGMLTGLSVGWFGLKFAEIGLSAAVVKRVAALNITVSSFAAGAICGARIAIPALVLGLIGWQLTPWLRENGWLGEKETFRRIGFIFSLGTIFGAALVDITLILFQAYQRYRQQGTEAAPPAPDWKRVNMFKLVVWIIFWGAATIVVGNLVMDQPLKFLIIVVLLCFLFVLVNGISLGLTDWNPISSAFVATVFIMAAAGLTNPIVGLTCASIMLIATSEGGDMQQDRSTGWRLGTNRVNQFRYQVIGIAMGAVLAIVLAKLFMSAYPVLKVNQLASPETVGVDKWQSAMTLKFVGALTGLTEKKPHILNAMFIGLAAGVLIEIIRKLVKNSARWKAFATGSRTGKVTDFLFDAVLISSPYASSFGGFVELPIVWWWAAGGVAGSLWDWHEARQRTRAARPDVELPSDMSTVSLVGGGLIAGEALAALGVGIYGLITSGALQKIFGG